MGSWDYSCAISGLNIGCGDKCRLLLMRTSNPAPSGRGVPSIGFDCMNGFALLMPPIKCSYADYGGVEDLDLSGHMGTLTYEKVLQDLMDKVYFRDERGSHGSKANEGSALEKLDTILWGCNPAFMKAPGLYHDEEDQEFEADVIGLLVLEDVWQRMLNFDIYRERASYEARKENPTPIPSCWQEMADRIRKKFAKNMELSRKQYEERIAEDPDYYTPLPADELAVLQDLVEKARQKHPNFMKSEDDFNEYWKDIREAYGKYPKYMNIHGDIIAAPRMPWMHFEDLDSGGSIEGSFVWHANRGVGYGPVWLNSVELAINVRSRMDALFQEMGGKVYEDEGQALLDKSVESFLELLEMAWVSRVMVRLRRAFVPMSGAGSQHQNDEDVVSYAKMVVEVALNRFDATTEDMRNWGDLEDDEEREYREEKRAALDIFKDNS